MRFNGLDLNLLVAFDALLTARSVSGAAAAMNLSQPAMSAALARLRGYFGDEILVPSGKRMYPTAFAESLLPQVRECLHIAERMISTSPDFDPATSHRTFRVVASDYSSTALIAPLIARLAQRAPHVRIEMLLPSDESNEQLERGKVDLMITPEDFLARHLPAELLFEERHVLVGWRGNSLFEGTITEAEVMAAGHVGVVMGNQRTATFADRHMQLLGKVRRIEVIASSFTMVPWLLLDTMRLGIMHERLALAMAGYFPISHAPMPFDLPVMREMIQYHHTRGEDEGLTWLRAELRALASEPSIPPGHGD